MDYQQKFKDIMNRLFEDTSGTFQEFYEHGFNSIPKEKGVYTVKLPKNFTFSLNENLGEIPERCLKEHDMEYLYIGKAENLRRRIKQYVESVCCKDLKYDNHKGGYPIKFVKNCKNLEISYITIEDIDNDSIGNVINKLSRKNFEDSYQAQSIETCLTMLHKFAYGNLPFANSEKQNTPKILINFWQNFWENLEEASKVENCTQKPENFFLSLIKAFIHVAINPPKHNDCGQNQEEYHKEYQEQNNHYEPQKQNNYNEQQRQYIEQQRQRERQYYEHQYFEQLGKNDYQYNNQYKKQNRINKGHLFYKNVLSNVRKPDGTFELHHAIMCALLAAYMSGVEYITPKEIAYLINEKHLYKTFIEPSRVSVRVNKPEYRNLFKKNGYGGIALNI